MDDFLLIPRQAFARLDGSEDAIDCQQDVLRGAERTLQPHLLEPALAVDHLTAELIAVEREGFRVRALEGIDRLLLVADGEDGAADIVAGA